MEQKIAEKIQEYKATVQKRKWAVWAWLGLAGLVVGYFLFTWWSTAGDRKKLAKLLHEKDVNEEKQQQLITAAKVATIEEEKDKLQQQILARSQVRATIEAELEESKARKEAANARIDQLKTWADVDSTVVFRNKSGNK